MPPADATSSWERGRPSAALDPSAETILARAARSTPLHARRGRRWRGGPGPGPLFARRSVASRRGATFRFPPPVTFCVELSHTVASQPPGAPARRAEEQPAARARGWACRRRMAVAFPKLISAGDESLRHANTPPRSRDRRRLSPLPVPRLVRRGARFSASAPSITSVPTTARRTGRPWAREPAPNHGHFTPGLADDTYQYEPLANTAFVVMLL